MFPIVFNVHVDSVSVTIKNALDNNLITWMPPHLVENDIAILLYADGTILLLDVEFVNAKNLNTCARRRPLAPASARMPPASPAASAPAADYVPISRTHHASARSCRWSSGPGRHVEQQHGDKYES